MRDDPITVELHQFIRQSIANDCQCILIGEKHLGSKNSLEALAEIAMVLRYMMNETGKKIVILSESFAAVSQTKNKPISPKIFKRKANDPEELMPDWQYAVTLSAYDIEIYGLENYKTDPSQKCKSAKDIDKFLYALDPDLLDKHHQRHLERYLKGTMTEDDYVYSGIRLYMLSNYRSIIPNEVFSNYVNLSSG